MTRLLAALVLCLLPFAAAGQTFPALFDVVDVPPGDSLNIRAAPDESARVIGTLPRHGRHIEVIRTQDGWGLVNSGETAGWARMRYLGRQPAGPHALAREITCTGTEPFWRLEITQGVMANFNDPEAGSTFTAIDSLQPSRNRSDRFVVWGKDMIALLSLAACGDGMSDRAYGVTLDLLRNAGGTPVLLSGCCNLKSN